MNKQDASALRHISDKLPGFFYRYIAPITLPLILAAVLFQQWKLWPSLESAYQARLSLAESIATQRVSIAELEFKLGNLQERWNRISQAYRMREFSAAFRQQAPATPLEGYINSFAKSGRADIAMIGSNAVMLLSLKGSDAYAGIEFLWRNITGGNPSNDGLPASNFRRIVISCRLDNERECRPFLKVKDASWLSVESPELYLSDYRTRTTTEYSEYTIPMSVIESHGLDTRILRSISLAVDSRMTVPGNVYSIEIMGIRFE